MPFRVIIADGSPVVRLGTRRIVESIPAEVIAETDDGTTTLAAIEKTKPDLLISEIVFSDMNGIDLLAQVQSASPGTEVVFLSSADNPTYIARAVVTGSRDYLSKEMGADRLQSSIKRALNGEAPLSTSLHNKLAATLGQRRDRGSFRHAEFTYREFQLLRHIAFGLSNREIAKSMEISVETVKEHVQNILRKTDAADRTQIAVWAVQAKVI